jgi:hypothetical protein
MQVLYNQVLQNNFSEAIGFRLLDITATNDFLFHQYIETTQNLFKTFDQENTNYLFKKKLLVIGQQHTLISYEMEYLRALQEEKIKVKHENTSSSLTKSFYNIMSSLTGSSSSSSSSSANHETLPKLYHLPSNQEIITLSKKRIRELPSISSFIDEKRRMLRMSIDPLQSLIACSDGFGRVTLFDIHQECFIRIWKGVRDAYLGWIVEPDEVNDNNNNNNNIPPSMSNSSHSTDQLMRANSGALTPTTPTPTTTLSHTNSLTHTTSKEFDEDEPSLRLVIFAPQLGIISIYKMKHGPCVRVIPVGMNTKLITLLTPVYIDNRK